MSFNMSKNIAINFETVSKKFKKGRAYILKEALIDVFRPNKQEDFWAIQDVTFQIDRGESVGIVGANGSGKSTILKLIAGITTPTKGKITIDGRISPLIELGAGFHPELTGRENIYLNGTILGLSKKEIDEKFNSIVDFSELGDFIDTPVKHYSSGMYMRLGFSVAVHTSPDILLVDEILAVGDIAFQKKCLDKIRQFHKAGTTIVIISHNMETLKTFCQRMILVVDGKILKSGANNKVIGEYTKLMST